MNTGRDNLSPLLSPVLIKQVLGNHEKKMAQDVPVHKHFLVLRQMSINGLSVSQIQTQIFDLM
jgi:hypothetical protein